MNMEEEAEEIIDDQTYERHPSITPTVEEREQIRSAEKNVIAGGIAGSIGKTVTAPLSRLTVLYQVSSLLQNKSAANVQVEDSLAKSMRNIIRREGFFSLWKGNFTAVIHRFPFSALNFAAFEALKTNLSRVYPQLSDSATLRMSCGAMAGALSCFACYPLDLIRVRLTVGSSSTKEGVMKGKTKLGGLIFDTAANIIEKDGFKGLYQGLTASLLVAVPNYALSFTVYGQVKQYILREHKTTMFVNQKTQHLSPFGSLISGSISGVACSTILFPLDVIRKRMQVSGLNTTPTKASTSSSQSSSRIGAKGLIDHARSIVAHDGIRGFYRGLLPEILKVCPMVAVTFCSYEMTKDLLDKFYP